MGFRNGVIARVWKVEMNSTGKSCRVELSVSRKKDDGSYEQTFKDSYVQFRGKACEKIMDMSIPCTVKLKETDTCNRVDKNTGKMSYTYDHYVYDICDPSEDNGDSRQQYKQYNNKRR